RGRHGFQETMVSRNLNLAIGVGVCALAGIVWFGMRQRPSDAEQIRTALSESIKAGKEGRPGSVMELLGKNFSVNDQVYGTHTNVAQFIRDKKPDIEIADPTPKIDGDTATITSAATVSLSLPQFKIDVRQVTLHFKKE